MVSICSVIAIELIFSVAVQISILHDPSQYHCYKKRQKLSNTVLETWLI